MISRRHSSTLPLLRAQPLFAGCSKKELQQLASLCSVVSFRPGELLTRQGQPGHEFFTLLDGEASVDRDGELVTSTRTGSAVGEVSLLMHTRRNATVVAATSVDALTFSELDFYTACNASIGFERAVVAAARAHA